VTGMLINTALNAASVCGIAGVIYLMKWARRRDRAAVALAYAAGHQAGETKLIASLATAMADGESLHDWVVATLHALEEQDGGDTWGAGVTSTEKR
jgi:hypothetical protein